MVPTFNGRLQTRTFVLLTSGLLWTLLVTPVLPRPEGATVGDAYKATLFVLFTVLVLGLVLWEPIYHGLMQFRWEKDWPIMFSLLEGINEGILAYVVLRAIGPPASGWAFVIHFPTTWLVAWLTAIGPLRVPFLRWRFRGGRII